MRGEERGGEDRRGEERIGEVGRGEEIRTMDKHISEPWTALEGDSILCTQKHGALDVNC